MTNSTPSRNIDDIANHMALALRLMLDAYDVPRRCCIEAHEALDSYAKWKDDLQTQAFGDESSSGTPMLTEVVAVTAGQDLDITHVLDMEAQFEALSYDNQAVFGALHQHEECLVDMALSGPSARAHGIKVEEVFDIVAEPLMTPDEFIEEPVESPVSAKTTTVEPAFTSVKQVNVKGLVKAKLKHLVGKAISVAAKLNGVFSAAAAAAATAVAWKARPSVGSKLREGYRTAYEGLTAERDIVKPMRRAVRGLLTVSPTAAGSERNRLKRLWISFWYRDLTRFVMVLIPGHYLITLPLAFKLGVEGDALRAFATFSYLGVLVWAVGDNDYSYNLGRIGLDACHKPLYSSSSSNPQSA